MEFSRYTKTFPCRTNSDRTLLFSSRTLAKLLVPTSLLKAVESDTLSPEEQQLLVRNGFLVADREEERRAMLSVLDKVNDLSSMAYITAVMNLDCNLACIYCYEGGHRGGHYMSQQTAAELVRFAGDNLFNLGKDVTIEFYGGEPLLSLDRIRWVSQQLKSTAQREGRSFAFTLVTNGTLLTADIVSELIPLGLRKARVTLDGPPDNHNCYRPYVSGKGSFDTIVDNLKEVCGLIRIGIGGNYTRQTYRKFPRLLDHLAGEGLTPERIAYVAFAPVAETLGKHLLPDFAEGCVSTEEQWVAEASLFLRDQILRRGYATPRVGPTVCMIEFNDNLVIHYDGTLYKCPAFIGTPGLEVGTLATGVRDYSRSHGLDIWKSEECLDCEYLPLCFGGCRFIKLLRDGVIDGVECRRTYFDANLEELIQQDIRYSSAQKLG